MDNEEYEEIDYLLYLSSSDSSSDGEIDPIVELARMEAELEEKERQRRALAALDAPDEAMHSPANDDARESLTEEEELAVESEVVGSDVIAPSEDPSESSTDDAVRPKLDSLEALRISSTDFSAALPMEVDSESTNSSMRSADDEQGGSSQGNSDSRGETTPSLEDDGHQAEVDAEMSEEDQVDEKEGAEEDDYEEEEEEEQDEEQDEKEEEEEEEEGEEEDEAEEDKDDDDDEVEEKEQETEKEEAAVGDEGTDEDDAVEVVWSGSAPPWVEDPKANEINALLVHACDCDAIGRCDDPQFSGLCPNMKRFLRVGCWASHNSDWCRSRVAQLLANLLAYHSLHCSRASSACNVPLCNVLRG